MTLPIQFDEFFVLVLLLVLLKRDDFNDFKNCTYNEKYDYEYTAPH